MSILLESLKQSKGNPDSDVPNIDDSHFDDEMLSDEWLLKKLKIWKMLTASLVIALILSWSYHYWSLPVEDLTDLSVKQPEHRSVEVEQPKSDIGSEYGALEIAAKSEPKTEQENFELREQYQPQKISPAEQFNLKEINSLEQKNGVAEHQQQNAKEKNVDNFNQSGDQVIDFEALSEPEKAELPELNISSYAVSSNKEKSFVVLNGAFYGPGETIAPNLILSSIDKVGIVVKYRGKLIRKKYSL